MRHRTLITTNGTMRHLKVKIAIALISTSLIILTWRMSNNVFSEPPSKGDFDVDVFKGREHPPPLSIVHLDLKGSPPKLSYLKELLPLIVASGGNALLIEYEDTFPYEGILRNVSAKHSYTRDEISELLSLCDYYSLEVIPLVQTFGHLEYLLKLEEFREVREDPASPQEICPSNARSIEIIEEMINQVLRLHKNARRIHIGCDEVEHMNVCFSCLKRNISSRDIFLNHVKIISSMIISTHPHIQPLIWDDMLRTWPASYIENSNLNQYVEPVIWIYSSDIVKIIPLTYWHWYFKHFPNIWIAGAFKGATTEMAMIPNMRMHLDNQEAWLQFFSKYLPKRTRIVGYVLTGWSRYDHFAALCELLPVSVPSLIVNLLKVSSAFQRQKHFHLLSSYTEVLRCKNSLTQIRDIIELSNTHLCSFPGQELVPLTLRLVDFQKVICSLYRKLYEQNAWMTAYHMEQKSINFQKVLKTFRKNEFQIVYHEFEKLCAELRFKLGKYFSVNVVDEWFFEHVQMYSSKLQSLASSFQKLRTYEVRRRFGDQKNDLVL